MRTLRAVPAVTMAGGALAVATLLGACSQIPQGDHRWISNQKERMYTRIPRSWKTYTVNPYELNTDRPAPIERTTSRWTMVIDSAPGTSKRKAVEHLDQTFPAHLVGEMSVQPLPSDWETGDPDQTYREGVSISALRRAVFAELPDEIASQLDGFGIIDPVKGFLAGVPELEVVAYDEEFRKDGLHGISMRMNYEVEPHRWITVDQRVLLDASSRKIYRLVLKCSSECFKANYSEAKRISSTWTVVKKK